jgi:hypothetical protein
MPSSDWQRVVAAHTAWREAESERDRLPLSEREEADTRVDELRTAYELAMAAVFPEVDLD